MFKQLKKASIYRAALPSLADLEATIEGNDVITNIDSLANNEVSRANFIRNPITGRFLTPLEMGYSLCVLVQERVLPASAIKSEVDKKVREIEENQCRAVRRKERQVIKDDVIATLIPRALINERLIYGFYDYRNKNLFVDNTSSKYSGLILSLIAQADGKVTTSTVHINDQVQGLTTRLTSHLQGGSYPFGDFELGQNIILKNSIDGSVVTFKETEFHHGEDEYQLSEKIEAGAKVHRIQLNLDGYHFTLTDKFKLTGIKSTTDQDVEYETAEEEWISEANATVYTLSKVVEKLCDMFGYEAPTPEIKQEAA